MNSMIGFIRKIFNHLVGNGAEADFLNDDVVVVSSSSAKRRSEVNCDEETLAKRRKLFSPVPAKDCADNSPSSNSQKKLLIEFQKENRFMTSDYLKKKRNRSLRLDRHDAHCNGNDDSCSLDKQNEMISGKKMNSLQGSIGFDQSDSDENSDCVVVKEVHSTHLHFTADKFSNLSLNRVQSIREHDTFLSMVRNECSTMRKNAPLMNSTVHNTKLNRPFSNDLLCSRSYLFRPLPMSSAKKKSAPAAKPAAEVNDSIFDKIVIDLTSSEDEDQRKAIESRIISSPEVLNMKSSFIAEDTYALDDDLISTLTKKYDAKIQEMKKRACNFEKTIVLRRDEFHKSISEILDQRLSLKEHETQIDDLQHKRSIELTPPIKEMAREINSILASKRFPLAQIKDTSVKIQDIRTLENTSWLNDEVINAYMNLIKLRYEKNPNKYPKVHCYNTFLYEQLSRKGYSSVRRWTRKIDIFDYEILIIPIHLGNHWCLIHVRFAEKCIFYYDSMGSSNNRCLKTILQYLVEEYKDKKSGTFSSSDWKLINVPRDELPQQKNAHDCGVFACTFAEHITRNAPFNFDQDDMHYFRVKMMYEILTEKLIL